MIDDAVIRGVGGRVAYTDAKGKPCELAQAAIAEVQLEDGTFVLATVDVPKLPPKPNKGGV